MVGRVTAYLATQLQHCNLFGLCGIQPFKGHTCESHNLQPHLQHYASAGALWENRATKQLGATHLVPRDAVG